MGVSPPHGRGKTVQRPVSDVFLCVSGTVRGLQILAPHLRSRNSNNLTSPAVFRTVVFDNFFVFVQRCLVLRDTDNELVSHGSFCCCCYCGGCVHLFAVLKFGKIVLKKQLLSQRDTRILCETTQRFDFIFFFPSQLLA